MEGCVPDKSKRKEKIIYLTPEAIRKKNLKNKLWRSMACYIVGHGRRYTRTRGNYDRTRFNSVKNELRSLTRKLKLEFERSLAQNIKTPPKSFWAYVKTKTNTRSKIPPLKKTDVSEAVTSIDKAETLLVVTLRTKDWMIYQTIRINHF